MVRYNQTARRWAVQSYALQRGQASGAVDATGAPGKVVSESAMSPFRSKPYDHVKEALLARLDECLPKRLRRERSIMM